MNKILRRLLLLLLHLWGASGARTAAQQSQRPTSATPRILLIRPDYLGDLVLTTPVLHALKAAIPRAHITMMVGPWSRGVVERHPDVDDLLTCPFPGVRGPDQKSLKPFLLIRTARKLRSDDYDLAISLLAKSWWSATLLYLACVPRRIGYATKHSRPFLTHLVPLPWHEHVTISALRLISAGLQSLGYSPLAEPYSPGRYPLHFVPTAQEHEWVEQRLSIEGIDATMPLVVIHPGSGAAVKLWRSEAWAHCAETLSHAVAESPSVRIVLTGSPGERALLQEIAQGTSVSTITLSDMSIGQLAALLKRAQLVLGVDSGPLHLATAQGTPTVRLFGPIDTRIFGPWGNPNQHLAVVSTNRCASCPSIPCGHLDFRAQELPSHPCVRLIGEQEVLTAISRLVPHLLPSLERPAEV